MRRTGLAIGGLLIGFGSVLAGDAPFPLVAHPIQAHAVRLGSPLFHEREAASRDLLKLGPVALKGIRALSQSTEDPEVRRRLELIAARLERNQLTSPTRVTLHAKSLSAKDALNAISRQTGYKIQVNGVGNEARKFDFDFDQMPFWQAVDTVANMAGLSINPQDNNGTLGVYYSNTYNPYTAYVGPFKIVATNINANQNLQLAGLPRNTPSTRANDYLAINFQIYAEPKVPIVGIGQVIPVKVTDENGNSLMPRENNQRHRSHYSPARPNYRSFNQSASVTLSRFDRDTRTVREFRGKMPVLILTETKPEITITGLLAAKEHKATAANIEVTMTNIAEVNGGAELTATFSRKNGDPNDYSWNNTITQRISVTDADGNVFGLNSIDYLNQNPNSCTIKFQFQPNGVPVKGKFGKPTKFVLTEWVTELTELDFSVQEIPLP